MNSIDWFRDVKIKKADPQLIKPLKITKDIFTFKEEEDFNGLANDINEFIGSNDNFEKISLISNIISLYKFISPKNLEFINNLEKAITFQLEEFSFFGVYSSFYLENNLPTIFNITSDNYSEVFTPIKYDQIDKLQEIVLRRSTFDFKYKCRKINMLDIAAYYGSVACFKYLMLNNTPFSKRICAYAIAGGNSEIIHLIENTYLEQNFACKVCFEMSIAYHRYDISDWLMLNYGHVQDGLLTALMSYNFLSLTYFLQS